MSLLKNQGPSALIFAKPSLQKQNSQLMHRSITRATIFFYLGAAVLGGELLTGPVLYFLMEVNKWLPIWLGLGCLGLATLIARLVPETLEAQARAPVDGIPAPTNHKPARLLSVARSMTWLCCSPCC